jgi:3',5'-cyclic-AMP phosphodiesterase
MILSGSVPEQSLQFEPEPKLSMPLILFSQQMGRRKFLSQSGMALAGLAFARAAAGTERAADDAVHLALLADTHIAADPKNEYRKFFPYENLQQIVPQLVKANPEGAIITGDVARLSGELGDYERVKELLSPLAEQMPVYFGLGNHDHRGNFLTAFKTPAGSPQQVHDKHVLVIERPNLRVIVLDSLLYVDRVAGLLGKAQRQWLDSYLAGSDGRPVVLFVHHTLGDGDGDLLDAERFFRIVQPHRKVKAVFYGHSHRYAFDQDRGLHYVNLPASGYNFRDQEPVGWVDAKFTMEGVALTLRALAGNREQDGKTVTLNWRS